MSFAIDLYLINNTGKQQQHVEGGNGLYLELAQVVQRQRLLRVQVRRAGRRLGQRLNETRRKGIEKESPTSAAGFLFTRLGAEKVWLQISRLALNHRWERFSAVDHTLFPHPPLHTWYRVSPSWLRCNSKSCAARYSSHILYSTATPAYVQTSCHMSSGLWYTLVPFELSWSCYQSRGTSRLSAVTVSKHNPMSACHAMKVCPTRSSQLRKIALR